jgi:hypothetical protein
MNHASRLVRSGFGIARIKQSGVQDVYRDAHSSNPFASAMERRADSELVEKNAFNPS